MPALPYVRAVSGTNGQITEDTPADFLEGDMELQVVLPNGKSVKSYFNRRTQMMDLLVQIGTRHQLATGDHFLQITDDVTGNPIPFLPSSVLGALDVRTVFVVPKSRINATKLGKKLNLPFEQTFRLKVYLPKNQLFVTRVSASTLLSTVLSIVCKEKQLNPKAYELRHPVNRLEPLNLSATLEDYNLCEVALVTARSQDISSDNWEEMPRKTSMNGSSVAIQPPPPQKQKRGLFSFVFGKKTSKTSVVVNSSSLSGGSIGDRSVSPVRSTSPDVSNSISPTTPPLATSSVVSAPSYSEKISSAKSLETMSMISDTSSTKGSGGVARFKKRQAPAPPPVNRMSSPLSKEHLSKLPETSKLQSAFSKSTSNLAYENRPGNRLSLSNLATANSTSTSSILSALRKSKKAPPPPSNVVHSSETTDERMVEEDKPVPTAKTEEATTIRTPEVEIKVEEPPVIVDKPSPVDTIDKKDKGDASSEEVAPEISEMEIQKESLNTTTSTISSDSLDVSQEERSPEVISRNEKEELSYDDVANTTERRGVKETDSDAYEDIELKTEENAEKPSTLLKDGNEKSEPVYAQVNKKKKNSKQEESVNGTIELTEISVSPLSDAPSDSNSSSNDSAIEISPTVIISRSSSPLDTWEYKIPDPPTPFKDLSSDEEVSDIVSDLLNTASFQEALLNESEGETKKVDEIIDVISETGPETLTITEPVKPDISEIVLQNEYIGESTTDVKKHVAINNLYETLDTQALKELTCKEASQVSEILVELSETLKKRESDSEVKEAPPVPDTIPPTESSESSRRSSISELSDKMRFSISTYKSRVEEEGLCYEKKLSRVDSKKSTGLDNDLSRRSSVCSESSRTSEIRDQNENVIKISELHDPIIIPPPIILDEPLVTEELIISENNVESIVLPPMDFVSEITSDSLIEKVELKKEQIILDLAKLEPVATDPSSLSNSTLSSRRNSVTPNVEPSSDLPSPLSLLLPAPSLFADDEDPEAIRLQEEYIQFQQRILAYQQKRLNQGSKNCVKQSEPCETPELANPEKNNYKAGEFSAVVEKSESMDKKVETPPKLQDENKVEAVNSTTSTSSLTTSIFQQVEQDITKNGAADLPRLHVAHKTVVNGNHILDNLRHEENEPVILTLNEDHIKAFSEIIEEKERSPSTQEDKVDMIPAPLTFSSNQPVMLDGICQTESDDYHSLVGIDTNSRPESQTSTRSGSDQPDDEIFRYRYQGPPKVVMEPWRSRPSVHVSISTNPVNAFNLDDLESKINAKKVEETIEVKELPKVESVKLKPVKENLENKDEKSQVESRKLSFESSRSAFESVTNRKPNLVRRTSIDTPRPFELKSLSQVRRPMFNPVQVGNKVVQPKMPFRVPEVRGFPLRTHSEAEEKSFVEKSRHDLIALARRPSAERDLISSEDRHHLSKLRDETDASRKIDVVVRRKVSIMERPKSADELDATAPNAKEASQKVGTLKHSTSADFQTSFWNELNGIKLRPVAGKQTEACAHLASVPAPPGPAPHISISTQSLPLLKKSNSSKIQSPIDTRGDLLNSIRSFGESNGLKKTGIRLT